MYWCFHCYALDDQATGPCAACGQPVEAPAGLCYADGLVWALNHPDGDRALLAARALGRLRIREAVPALRAVAENGRDVYLREAALRSVIEIEGTGPLRCWLEEMSRSGPFNVRATARQALRAALAPGSTGLLIANSPSDGKVRTWPRSAKTKFSSCGGR
jgi:HEAT repeats